MKYLVIGISGSGKTTVAHALSKSGHNSYDLDDMARWENSKGEPVKLPTNPTKDFFEHNFWIINKSELAKILKNKDDVYACGSPSNSTELADLFDKVFLLKISEDTLRQRLSQRDNNDFGKHPEELAVILSWHDEYQEDWRKRGAKVIDADQPLADVVREILEVSNA